MTTSRLRINDEVMVLSGRDKGRIGYIVRFSGKDRVVVSNVNVIKRHTAARKEGDQSGIISKEAPLHISNVAIYNNATEKRDKVKIVEKDGERVRVFKSTSEEVDI